MWATCCGLSGIHSVGPLIVRLQRQRLQPRGCQAGGGNGAQLHKSGVYGVVK